MSAWTKPLVAALGLLAAACGSRTGLLVDEPGAGATEGGTPPGDAQPETDGPDRAIPPLGWAVGFNSVCFLQTDGGAGCFELPSAPMSRSYNVTLEAVEGVAGATQIAGREGFCALLNDGTVTCWTRLSLDGGFGMGPAKAVRGLDHVVQVDAADIGRGGFGCAVRTDGSVWCWGSDMYNDLGRGTCPGTDCDNGSHPPGPVVHLSGAVEVAVSSLQVCAKTGVGDVYCWGRVGIGGDLAPDHSVPIAVPAAHGAIALALSEGETLATLPDTFVYFGAPMEGEGPDAPSPVTRPRTPGEQAFGSQYNTFCTKAPGAPVHCKGGIGLNGAPCPATTAYDVPGTEGAIDVSVSTFTACARLSEADLLCWGAYTVGPTRIHIE